MTDHDEDSFYTRPATNLLATVLFNIKFYMKNDSNEQIQCIVPEFFANKFINDFSSFSEDLSQGVLNWELAESIYDVFSYFPDLDFSMANAEYVEIIWALNIPVAGFPGWLDGYELK